MLSVDVSLDLFLIQILSQDANQNVLEIQTVAKGMSVRIRNVLKSQILATLHPVAQGLSVQ